MKQVKLLLTLMLPFAIAQTADAQYSSNNHSVLTRTVTFNPKSQQHGVANKTTDAGSRLIAWSDYTNDGALFQPTDSSEFMYSGTRGGDLNHTMKYDVATNWSYSAGAFVNNMNYINTYDSVSGNVATSISQTWDGVNMVWVNSTQNLYFYNAQNLLDHEVSQVWNTITGVWVNVSRDVYTYLPSGLLNTDVNQNWDGVNMAWVSNTQNFYFYSTSNYLYSIVGQMYDIATNNWVYTKMDTFSLNIHNDITKHTLKIWNTTTNTWQNSNRELYGYDTAENNLTETTQTWSGTAWTNVTLTTNSSFTAAHNPQIQVLQNWNNTTLGWDNVMEYANAYNGNDQLVTRTGQSWNAGQFWEFAAGDPMNNYYYESFDLSVKAISNNGGNATIYPVPATNTLNINLTWNEAQASTVSIYDMQGRVMNSWNIPSATHYATSISVNELPSGSYFIKIQGAKGQITNHLVVAH